VLNIFAKAAHVRVLPCAFPARVLAELTASPSFSVERDMLDARRIPANYGGENEKLALLAWFSSLFPPPNQPWLVLMMVHLNNTMKGKFCNTHCALTSTRKQNNAVN
jgi:hypothetical protein